MGSNGQGYSGGVDLYTIRITAVIEGAGMSKARLAAAAVPKARRLGSGGEAHPVPLRTEKKGAGGARTQWELLSGKALARPGAQLMNLILTAAMDRGLNKDETARQALGVGYSYLYGLLNGHKEISQLGEEHISKAARFLGLSRVATMLAAGQLSQEDFYAEPGLVRDYLGPAMRYIQADPAFAPFIPASVANLTHELQHAFVLLYERATGRTLIPGRVSPEEIAKRHKQLPQGDE